MPKPVSEYRVGKINRRNHEGQKGIQALSVKIADEPESNDQYQAKSQEEVGVFVFLQVHFYDFINENTAIGNHQKEKPFLNGQAIDILTKGIFGIEAPDLSLGKMNVPDQEEYCCNQNGRKNVFYLLSVLFPFIKALDKGNRNRCDQ